jgi:hypothetical protein
MSQSSPFDPIAGVLSDIREGKLIVVTDDADRENEGDLVLAAEKVTPEAVNFMAMHGRGLICVPILEERADALGLERMVARNRESHKTDFTVSVDAAEGISTGHFSVRPLPHDCSSGGCFHEGRRLGATGAHFPTPCQAGWCVAEGGAHGGFRRFGASCWIDSRWGALRNSQP